MRPLIAALVISGTAHAGGLILPTRGMHSTERASALVAGADDADALFLDPAGLARVAGDGKRSLVFDVGYLYESQDYVSTTGTAANQQPGTVQFTVAGALGIGDRLVIGGGVTTLPAGVHHYDNRGLARYASSEAAGTQFVTVAVGAAYILAPNLRVGATLQDTVSMLDWSIVASACTSAGDCTNAGYDLPLHLTQNNYIAPSGSLGAQYDAGDFTLGAVVQAPTRISGHGSLVVTPPAASAFTGMAVEGSGAETSLWLPPSVRVGTEWHRDGVRVEATVGAEFWGLVTSDVEIRPSVSIGSQALAPMAIRLDAHTSVNAALGGEVHIGDARIAAGIGYESAAIKNVSTFAIDAPKLLLGLGGGYSADGWDFGGTLGFAKLSSVTQTGSLTQLEPLAMVPTLTINAGTYSAYDLTAGLRASRRF